MPRRAVKILDVVPAAARSPARNDTLHEEAGRLGRKKFFDATDDLIFLDGIARVRRSAGRLRAARRLWRLWQRRALDWRNENATHRRAEYEGHYE
jgi:hypothetical protein